METGCVSIFRSKLPSNINFRTKITRMPAKRGSVGRYISIGNSVINSLKGTDKGTKKTIPNSSLSRAKNAAKINKIATGTMLK